MISIAIVDWVLFSIALQYSIYFASLWPYLSQARKFFCFSFRFNTRKFLPIDHETTEKFFGWVIAIYCVGQIVASPIYGYWSNHAKSLRFAAVTAVLFGIVGNLIFILAENFPTNRRFVLLGARVVMGLSSGKHSSISKMQMQTQSFILAVLHRVYLLGIQALVAFVGYPGHYVGPFHINMYTMPAILLMMANAVSVVLMLTMFKDDYTGIKESRSESTQVFVSRLQYVYFRTFDLQITLSSFPNSRFQRVGSPFGMAMFNWTRKEATVYGSILMGVSSILSLLIYILYAWKGRKYLFSSHGPMAVWSMPILLMVSSVVLVSTTYDILVPLELHSHLKSGQSLTSTGGSFSKF
ncbi:unnamed protein product [Soboliphyme baturini]|uniref:Major facilitator superfamily domain-containing protein 8 n=1 Tax=Soboliphyme baturini TaxID=241478 RepID=A0A183IX97_9BILA|nr:unnamed protein product [Soboliphyme baturini]